MGSGYSLTSAAAVRTAAIEERSNKRDRILAEGSSFVISSLESWSLWFGSKGRENRRNPLWRAFQDCNP